MMHTITTAALLATLAACGASPQQTSAPDVAAAPDAEKQAVTATYILGPEDQIAIHVVDAEEVGNTPFRIDMNGYIRVPLIGRVPAGGLTVEQLEADLTHRFKAFLLDPDVSVKIAEFGSQPVSIIGCVKNPGVHQLQGRKTLVQMLSEAGGLSTDAGPFVKVTRRILWGRIPLPGATLDPAGDFSVAQIRLKSILNADNPEQNIIICPNDVISVPRAEMIYVTGQVVRSGGFVLNERESMSVAQALALAGGLDHSASPQNSRILRYSTGAASRVEIAVDIKKILAGHAEDLMLKPDDILFIPTSAPKKAALRAVEAAIQIGTGVVIWRR